MNLILLPKEQLSESLTLPHIEPYFIEVRVLIKRHGIFIAWKDLKGKEWLFLTWTYLNVHFIVRSFGFMMYEVPESEHWTTVTGNAKEGDTVLIHGASGGVGLAAVQLAVNHGMKVIGTAGTREGLDLARSSGAKLVYNHREAGYLDQIKKDIGGELWQGYESVVIALWARANWFLEKIRCIWITFLKGPMDCWCYNTSVQDIIVIFIVESLIDIIMGLKNW
jgi:hypothetical protein